MRGGALIKGRAANSLEWKKKKPTLTEGTLENNSCLPTYTYELLCYIFTSLNIKCLIKKVYLSRKHKKFF